MPIGSYIAVYFIVWWICLFMVLPFKVRSQIEDGVVVPGTDPGAPTLSRIGPKMLINTGLAAVVTLLLFWALSAPWLQEYFR
ncbi:DUF1467 family protein [Devosia sp.]|uniref:DUF1467 family protein n=1 Tax=Devosia sp. TaxID=1871048 RepID=UPI0032635C34